jgi:hypothetical protein
LETTKFNVDDATIRTELGNQVLESKNASKINEEITTLTNCINELKRRRRALQGVAPSRNAAQVSVISTIQRTEDDMQRASEDLNQCEILEDAIDQLTSISTSNICEARYKSSHLIPKRQRTEKVVAQGVDLSFSQERKMKEGLSAEAAAQAQRPMIYHKGLQKWVPLPTGDDADNWRD